MTDSPANPPSVPVRKKAMVYVDGFNLYFGILQGTPDLKWLNLESFMDFLRPDEEVLGVRYFTALVDPQKHLSVSRDRQKRYLQALGSCPKLKVIMGKYQLREVSCRGKCRERYEVPEEKKTDVGIAVQMISDAIDGLMDRIVLVSGDSDLEPAVEWIRKRHPGHQDHGLHPAGSRRSKTEAERHLPKHGSRCQAAAHHRHPPVPVSP